VYSGVSFLHNSSAPNTQSFKRARWVDALCLLAAPSSVLLDQLTKHWATEAYGQSSEVGNSYLGGWLSLVYTTNSGAAFGILEGRNALFLLIGIVVCSALAVYWRLLGKARPVARIGLGLLLGGACGNAIDRARNGHVVDFLQIRFWPVFNLADLCIVVGVMLLLYAVLDMRASG